MAVDSKLKLVAQPQEFFYELITDALSNSSYRPRPETEVYLVNLLGQFMKTNALYRTDAEGHQKDESLAIMIKEAIDSPEIEAQRLLFRQVGDVSLYTAGFFQDSLNRKVVDLDYYIDMGGAAYQNVAARADERALRNVFEELAASFSVFVDVLADVSDRTTVKSEKNLLRLYELWTRTKSERAAKALQEAGIIPVNAPGKKLIQ